MSLLPASRLEEVLRMTGLGQGVMEAAYQTAVSRKYLSAEAKESVLALRYQRAIARSLDQLEKSIDCGATAEITMGDIAVAVALDYLQFRLPELETAKKYPTLDVWRAHITQRPSFESTAF
jgi:glutathione S-transferase